MTLKKRIKEHRDELYNEIAKIPDAEIAAMIERVDSDLDAPLGIVDCATPFLFGVAQARALSRGEIEGYVRASLHIETSKRHYAVYLDPPMRDENKMTLPSSITTYVPSAHKPVEDDA